MTPDILLTLLAIAGVMLTLVLTRLPPDGVLLGAVVLLAVAGVIEPAAAVRGFANEATLTVAAFYVIAAGLRETGGLAAAVNRLLGRNAGPATAQLRIMAPVAAISAFVNNTPVVAAFLPAVSDWARKRGMSPSRLLLPLSYGAILGGTCTIVGTSTNLVVNGLLQTESGGPGLGFFDIAWVGVPTTVLGIAYVIVASPWLLRDRVPAMEILHDPREYTVEMEVEENSPLVGKTIEEAGLRHLPGLYLVEIERALTVLAPVGPAEKLRGGDRLVFAGIPESVLDLQNFRGLRPALRHTFRLASPRRERRFFEVVLGEGPVTGHTVRDARFRGRYSAAVIAIARDGRRVNDKIGNVRLAPGDTLLLETDAGWDRRHRHNREFLLVRPVAETTPARHERAWLAWSVLTAVLVLGASGAVPLMPAALLGAGAMVLLRCLSLATARASVDLQVIVVIASAFGLSEAMRVSGAGAALGEALTAVAAVHPLMLLAAVYVSTALLTAVMTNTAAAALMFPIAAGVATGAGLDLVPFAVAIAMAASAEFSTPIGYQTNLMVYGPGGYRFGDYFRLGFPLNVLAAAVTLTVVPAVWPLG